MKKLILGILFQAALFGQSGVTLQTPPPARVNGNQVFLSVTGTPGNTTYYYWLITTYPIGSVGTTGPIIINNAPNTLNGSNYVNISWNAVTGASSYDLLRNTTGITPSPGTTCTCAVAAGLTTNSTTDMSNSLTSYTVPLPVPFATANITLDNQNYTVPTVVFNAPTNIPGGAGITYTALSPISINSSTHIVSCPTCIITPVTCGNANANWLDCTITVGNVLSPFIHGNQDALNGPTWNWASNNQGEFMNIWIDGSQGTPFPTSGFITAPKVRYDNAVFSMYVPSSAHAEYGNGVAMAAYTRTDNTAIPGLPIYGQCLIGVDSAAACEAANFVSVDADCKDYTPSCTSHPIGFLATEYDISVTNSGTNNSFGYLAARPWSIAQATAWDSGYTSWQASLPYQQSISPKTFNCNGCTPGAPDTLSELVLPSSWSGGPISGDPRIKMCIKDDGTGAAFYFYADTYSGTYCAGVADTEGPFAYSTTTPTFMANSGFTTLSFTFGHATGHNINDTWAWPATGNSQFKEGMGCLDGSVSLGCLSVGATNAGNVPNDDSQRLLFHYKTSLGGDATHYIYLNHTNGFVSDTTFVAPSFLANTGIQSPGIKLTGIISANTLGTDSSGNVGASNGDPTNVHYVASTLTITQLNAGTQVILPAVSGKTLRVINFYGQNAGSFTTCGYQLSDTNGTPVVVASVSNSGISAPNKVTQSSATVTLGAGWLTQLTANQGLEISSTGGTCGGGTSITAVVLYSVNN